MKKLLSIISSIARKLGIGERRKKRRGFKDLKKTFVRENRKFCDDVFIRNGHSGYKAMDSVRLIVLARKELKYSRKTCSMDVYFGVFNSWESMRHEGHIVKSV